MVVLVISYKTPTHHFSGCFTGKPVLAGSFLDSQSPVILSILTGLVVAMVLQWCAMVVLWLWPWSWPWSWSWPLLWSWPGRGHSPNSIT